MRSRPHCQTESNCQPRKASSRATLNQKSNCLMLIDSHCHLDMFDAAERDDVIARANAEGVTEMVTIGTRMGQSRQLLDLVRGRDRVWCTVGVHPNSVGEDPLAETGRADFQKLTLAGRVE